MLERAPQPPPFFVLLREQCGQRMEKYGISLGNGAPLQYSCLENSMDRGAWWAAVHGVTKSRTRLSDFTFTFHFHALEKEMATHSSVLAWRIPGMGEPAWWAPVYGVAQSGTLLKRLSSSSRSSSLGKGAKGLLQQECVVS